MVNYGFDCVRWTKAEKLELAREVEKILPEYVDANGRIPEVEVDGTYPGVRIRKLTWLTDAQILELTEHVDRIYTQVRVQNHIKIGGSRND